jgi:hypothetical protein
MFRAKVKPVQLRRPWKAQFVISTDEDGVLPRNMAERDRVKTICVIEARLDNVTRIVKNRHWWNSGERYELAFFEIQLIPESTSLKFRLLSDGKLLNSEQDKVTVTWDTARVQSMSSLDPLDQMYLV